MAKEHAGAELWLAAGERLLAAGGVSAVKLPGLAATVGLTTGSFYHHFANMTDFLDRLAARCSPGTIEPPVAPNDPRQRLRAELVAQWGTARRGVGGALRDWSTSHAAARRAVHDSDGAVLTRLKDAFVELGHDEVGARARALLALGIGVASMSPPWGHTEPTVDEVLAVLAPKAPE